MDEYIKREAAIERLKKNLYASNPGSFSYLCFQDAINSVQEIPAADVEPVKRGRWLPQILNGIRIWDCSECKTIGSPQWKRCPVCEAKMDEEANNER